MRQQHLIDMLQSTAKQLGRTPRGGKGEFVYEELAMREFGSWSKFVKAAGLSTAKPSNEFLIQEVQRLAEELGRAPVGAKKEFAYTDMAIYRFGTWRHFIQAAGLTDKVVHVSRNRKYSDADLIQEAQRMAQTLGRAPSSTQGEFPYRMTVMRRFGSWPNFLEAAGLTEKRLIQRHRRPKRYSDAFLLQEIRRVAEEFGRTPVSTKSKREFAYINTASMRFGSWKKFVEAAGLEVVPRAKPSK